MPKQKTRQQKKKHRKPGFKGQLSLDLRTPTEIKRKGIELLQKLLEAEQEAKQRTWEKKKRRGIERQLEEKHTQTAWQHAKILTEASKFFSNKKTKESVLEFLFEQMALAKNQKRISETRLHALKKGSPAWNQHAAQHKKWTQKINEYQTLIERLQKIR
jgi:hypothetical protein